MHRATADIPLTGFGTGESTEEWRQRAYYNTGNNGKYSSSFSIFLLLLSVLRDVGSDTVPK